MKKLAYKIVIFLMIVFVSSEAITYALKKIDPNFAEYSNKIARMLLHHEDLEALAVGSSHSIGLDFDVLGYSGYHIWQYNGDLHEVKYQLYSLDQFLPNLEVVFIPISYFTFFWDNSISSVSDRKFIRRELYSSFNGFSYIEGDFFQLVLGKVSHVDDWKKFAISFLKPHKKHVFDNYGRPIFKDKTRFDTPALMADDAINVSIPYQVSHLEGMINKNSNIQSINTNVLIDIIDFLNTKKVRVVLFTPPYYSEYNKAFPDKYIIKTRNIINTVVDITDVEYYDFSSHFLFENSHELFYDSHHLNLDGSKLFSQELRNIMDKHDTNEN